MRDKQEETSGETSHANKTEGAPVTNTADLPDADIEEFTPAVHGPPQNSNTKTSKTSSETSICLQETCVTQELNGSAVSTVASVIDVAEAMLPLSSWSPEQGGRGLADGEGAISSTSFIGPMCRPQVAKSPDMEEKLSEFYKELEEIGSDYSVNACHKPERPVEPEKPPNTIPKEDTRLKFNRDHRHYHIPHPYLGPHRDRWHDRRHRQNLLCGLDGKGWGAHYQGQWQHVQHFGGPLDPSFSGFYRPGSYRSNEGPFPPPPENLYHPNFGPQISTWYNYPETVPNVKHCEWDQPFPPSSEFTAYDDYRVPTICHGSTDGSYTTGTLFHLSEQRYSGFNHNFIEEHNPQQHHPRQEHHESLDSGMNYQIRKCPPNSSLVLVLMRGLPGSGKSTLAQELRSSGPSGLVLSTDDYFYNGTGYAYNPSLLGDAHEWNQKRARKAMDESRSPVIIDNTNMQAWEMKPYAKHAVERGYCVEFCEPNTSWRRDPLELEKRNKHRVPRYKIAQMLERFELPMSLDIVLNSQEPPHKGPGRSSAQGRKTPETGPQSH
ncbi:NEDD4-binding protein 2-like 2 [Arapaima gigas]